MVCYLDFNDLAGCNYQFFPAAILFHFSSSLQHADLFENTVPVVLSLHFVSSFYSVSSINDDFLYIFILRILKKSWSYKSCHCSVTCYITDKRLPIGIWREVLLAIIYRRPVERATLSLHQREKKKVLQVMLINIDQKDHKSI